MKTYVIALIVVLIVIGIYYLHRKHRKPKKPTLYDRLGGIFPIAMIVDEFSNQLIENPIVGVRSLNPFLADWHKNKLDRLPGLKWQRTLWLASIAGGPYKYHGTKPGKCPFSLENAHRGLVISPDEFDAVAKELSNSLNKFRVPLQEMNEVLAAFAAHRDEVTMGYNISKGLIVKPITCPYKK